MDWERSLRNATLRTAALLLGLGACATAWAQPLPDRQIPPSVMAEVREVEHRFEQALDADCDPSRCFSKGCAYAAHAVTDRPRATSLPGLGADPGPGSVEAQEYLTQARCSFAHEDTVSAADAQALVRRLQSKLSTGWTRVSVGHQELEPLPQHLLDPAEADAEAGAEEEEAPAPLAEALSASDAARELWASLLPHFYWMIAVVLITLAGAILIWAWRRVGRESLEERALLAQLEGEAGAPDSDSAGPAPSAQDDTAFVLAQSAAWTQRLEAMDPASPDPEVQALVRALLRSGDLPLLAKAVLRFPDTLPAAFPAGGDVAKAKLQLADFLKDVDVNTLPSDAVFFRALNRHALSATLASQSDARVIRSLREDFGASGLVSLIANLPARPGALLFALAPATEQLEMVRLLSPRQMTAMSEQLLHSNRMDASETEHLFEVLESARAGRPPPAPRPVGEVSDRGATFDAAGALSVLLPAIHPTQRDALFAAALERFNGSLPAWYRSIFLADMLFQISSEARNDLMLEIDVEALAGWTSLLDAETRSRITTDVPSSLRATLSGISFPSRQRQLAQAERGREELARGFQRQLARANVPFERAVQPRRAAGP